MATTPTVTLSPNARNLVFEIVARRDTITGNAQEPERFSESVAVHRTSVDPTGNVVPDGGAHTTVTGDSPPSDEGVVYVTVEPVPVVVTEMGGRHATVGGSGTMATGGGTGATGGGGAGTLGLVGL